MIFCFFFSSRRRHTRCSRDWSSDVCSSDLSGSGGKIEGVGKRPHGESWPGYPALTNAQPREPPAECINEVRAELALILHHSPAAVIEQSGSWRLSGELRLPQISLDSG